MKKCLSAAVLCAVFLALLAGCSSEYKFKYDASAAFSEEEELNTYSFPSGLAVSYPAAYEESDSGIFHYFRPDSTNFAFTQYMEIDASSLSLDEIKDNFVDNLEDYKKLGDFTFSSAEGVEGVGIYGSTTSEDTDLNVLSVLVPHNQYVDVVNFAFIKDFAAFEKEASSVINSLRSGRTGGFNLLNDDGTDLSDEYRADLEFAWKGVNYRAAYFKETQSIVIFVQDADLSNPDHFLAQAIITMPPIPLDERDVLQSISLNFNFSNSIQSFASKDSVKIKYFHDFDETADYYNALEKAYTECYYFSPDISVSSSNGSEKEPASTPETLADQQPDTPFFTYSGSGDDVVTGLTVDSASFLRVKNAGGGHFAVKAHHGDRYDLLVNTVAPYEGDTLLLPYGEYTLEVSASGAWTAEAFALGTSSSDTFSSTGDFVTPVFISSSDVYEITAPGGRHFAVKGYYGDGRYELLVNTTDDYAGKVMFKHKGDHCFFVVTGERDVTITPQ